MVLYLTEDDRFRSFLAPSMIHDWLPDGSTYPLIITDNHVRSVRDERLRRLRAEEAFQVQLGKAQAVLVDEYKGLILGVCLDIYHS